MQGHWLKRLPGCLKNMVIDFCGSATWIVQYHIVDNYLVLIGYWFWCGVQHLVWISAIQLANHSCTSAYSWTIMPLPLTKYGFVIFCACKDASQYVIDFRTGRQLQNYASKSYVPSWFLLFGDIRLRTNNWTSPLFVHQENNDSLELVRLLQDVPNRLWHAKADRYYVCVGGNDTVFKMTLVAKMHRFYPQLHKTNLFDDDEEELIYVGQKGILVLDKAKKQYYVYDPATDESFVLPNITIKSQCIFKAVFGDRYILFSSTTEIVVLDLHTLSSKSVNYIDCHANETNTLLFDECTQQAIDQEFSYCNLIHFDTGNVHANPDRCRYHSIHFHNDILFVT
jgi:hypothetical protein